MKDAVRPHKNKTRDNNGINIRELALDVLLDMSEGDGRSSRLLRSVLDKYDYLPDRDKSFLKRLVNGSMEYRIRLDHIIDMYSKTPVAKMKPLVRELIRMSTYQILYMDRVPDSAACNEAVKLVRKRGLGGLSGFVNGVLRAIAGNKDSVPEPKEGKDGDYIRVSSIKWSCPEVIVRELVKDYGREKTEDILKAALVADRGVWVRIDESLDRDTIDKIRTVLVGDAGTYESKVPEDIHDIGYAVRITDADKVTHMSYFTEGHITIQDLSSMMVCELAGLDEYAGKRISVLDMCAAPGGKTMHAVSKCIRYGVDAGVRSLDVSEGKRALIDDNIHRLGYEDRVSTGVWDATVYDGGSEEAYDVVIADVPCSGLGVMGRKPDIKYNVTAEGLQSIVALQRRILDNAVRYVKRGGRLVFSTCTMRKAENDCNTRYILDTGEYELIKEKQLYLSGDHDGFYIAVLNRR